MSGFELERQACEMVAENGGVLTLPGSPLVTVLVARLFWAEPGVALVFPAFGEGPRDTVVLKYDATFVYPFGIAFNRGDRVCAIFAPIEKAMVDDRDDYWLGWQLWKEVEPLRRDLIDYAFAVVAEDLVAATGPVGVLDAAL